ncbi:hypothetical protein GW17_00053556 [Ensete ventricosum]|nr:hypothetical protein GW17_00053556 [Ensete ventricosum]RZR86544.1 hypothetical protein BHM03_00013766 [Ensete ventricosum]
MGLITHNRIYVCIGASPYPVIIDLVIIGSAATLAAGVAGPAVGRVGRERQPLAGTLQTIAPASVVLQAAMPAGGCRPYGLAVFGRARGQLLPLRAAAFANGRLLHPAASCKGPWPQSTTPVAGLAMGGCPSKGSSHGRPPL